VILHTRNCQHHNAPTGYCHWYIMEILSLVIWQWLFMSKTH